MKRFISIVILLSMTLHCASRLGAISYLYENRHDIAYRIGLIAEIPIAMCSGDYFATHGPLVIHNGDMDDSNQLPAQITIAREITLFSHTIDVSPGREDFGRMLVHNTAIIPSNFTPPSLAIFHPPCQALFS